jgi:hypothetical protein
MPCICLTSDICIYNFINFSSIDTLYCIRILKVVTLSMSHLCTRKSSGFSRGASAYRGVTRHHQHGRWQARIGRVAGNKDLYLGTYSETSV